MQVDWELSESLTSDGEVTEDSLLYRVQPIYLSPFLQGPSRRVPPCRVEPPRRDISSSDVPPRRTSLLVGRPSSSDVPPRRTALLVVSLLVAVPPRSVFALRVGPSSSVLASAGDIFSSLCLSSLDNHVSLWERLVHTTQTLRERYKAQAQRERYKRSIIYVLLLRNHYNIITASKTSVQSSAK
jgi:hypothetical protein